MEKPIEPQIYEFGITQDDISNHLKLSGRQLQIMIVLLCLAISFYFTWDKYLWDKNLKHLSESNVANAIKYSIMFVFLGIASALPAMVIALGVDYAIVRVQSSINENYRKVEEYNSALSKYAYRLSQYEEFKLKAAASYWRSLSGVEFERALGNIYWKKGYAVEYTPSSGDGGVDLILRKNGITTIVQCKAHAKKIPISVARELAASIIDFKADNAIIACFEGVTKPVTDYIINKPITVITINEIINMHINT